MRSLCNHEYLNAWIPNVIISIYRKSHNIEQLKKDENLTLDWPVD